MRAGSGSANREGSTVAVREIRDLWSRAVAEGDQGRPQTAIRSASRALRKLLAAFPDERNLHARILLTLAYQRFMLGQLTDALDLVERAERIEPAIGPLAEANRGEFLKLSQPAAAMAHFDRAVAGLRSVGTDDGQEALAIALLNRGVVNMSMGRIHQAQMDTQSAAAAATKSGSEVIAFMATHNLGYVRFLSGDLPGALDAMASASTLRPAGATGMSALDRARVLVSAGLIDESRAYINQAVESFSTNRATLDLADALRTSAEIALLSGDPTSAKASARRARQIAVRTGNERGALVNELLGVRAAAMTRGADASPRSARRDALLAEALAVRLRHADLAEDARAARLLQAEALLQAGDVTGASQALSSASTGRSPAAGSLAVRLHTHLVDGKIQLASGRRSAGLAEIRRGLDDLADFQARFGSQDLQSAAAIHGRELARLGLRTATERGSPAAILQWLERARAVTTRLPAVRPSADPVLAEDLGALRVADEQARAALLSGRRDAAADHRVAELRRRVRARSWTVSGSGRADRPPTLAAVKRQLAQHHSNPGVVALFVGAGKIHALVITAHRAVHVVLAERDAMHHHQQRLQSDLDLLAEDRVPEPLKAVAARSLAASLEQFTDVLAPVLRILGDGPVLIAAVGPLATMPWLLLPGLAGRPVTVSSSVTRALAGLAQPPDRVAAHGVLVVAGPGVTNGDKEALAVAALHPGAQLLLGAEATGPAVLAAIPQGGLVHIAAHGHHETGNPLFSGVQLADGLLFGYDLAPNPTLPGQVVLSSCDVGQTDDRPGGEPLGLVAALVRSGIPTVVSGTSKIADIAAEATMVGYHQRLIAGAAPGAALAGAVAAAGADTGLPAPFSCFGAGLQTGRTGS